MWLPLQDDESGRVALDRQPGAVARPQLLLLAGAVHAARHHAAPHLNGAAADLRHNPCCVPRRCTVTERAPRGRDCLFPE